MTNIHKKLATNEQTLLYLGLILFMITLLIFTVILPFHSELKRYRNEVPKKVEQLAWMKNAANEVNHSINSVTLIKGEGLQLSMLHETAATNKLRKNIKRLEPDTNNKARIWLESASYIDLVKWLSQLEEKGITVTHFSADRLAVPGVVNAKITLQIIDES